MIARHDTDLPSRLSAHRAGRGWRHRVGRPGVRAPGTPANQPPNVPDWTRSLGDGVAVRKYGTPSKHEARGHSPRRRMAHGNAAKLGQLHAAARARWRHHAERPVLRASSFRHCRGGPGRLSAHSPWPGRQTPDLHARRHQAHAARQSGVFLRVRGQFRDGMARRPAQRRAVHARHGALRDVYRRAAQDPAGRGRRSSRTPSGCCWKAAMPPRCRARCRWRRRWTTRSWRTA